MKFHTRYNDHCDVIAYLLTFLIIISSKTVFFGIVYLRETLIVSFICLLVVMMIRNRDIILNGQQVRIFITFSFLLCVVSCFYIGDIFSDFNSYVGALIIFLLVLAIAMLYVNTVTKKQFIICYVHIMVAISWISLIYFFLFSFNRSLVLNMGNIYTDGDSSYIALPWYTFGWQVSNPNNITYDYLFGRNAGPFWEPGAFQGFIFIALFLLLFNKELFKYKVIILVTFVLTLITTQSTAGYLVLIISLIGFSTDYVECLFGKTDLTSNTVKMRYLMYIIAVIIGGLVAYFIISTGNIEDKFSSSSGSLADRLLDINTAFSVLLYNPLAGIGLGQTGIEIADAQTVSATTLLAIAQYFGIPFMLYYAYRFFNGAIVLYNPKGLFKRVVLVACFFVILMTETLYMLPVYSILLFITNGGGYSH